MKNELKKNTKLNFDNKNYKLNILYSGTLGITRNPSNILDIFNNFSKKNKKFKITFKFASQDNPFDFIKKKSDILKLNGWDILIKKN